MWYSRKEKLKLSFGIHLGIVPNESETIKIIFLALRPGQTGPIIFENFAIVRMTILRISIYPYRCNEILRDVIIIREF